MSGLLEGGVGREWEHLGRCEEGDEGGGGWWGWGGRVVKGGREGGLGELKGEEEGDGECGGGG